MPCFSLLFMRCFLFVCVFVLFLLLNGKILCQTHTHYILSLLVLKGESVLAITKHCNLGCRNLFLPGLGTEKLTYYQQIWCPARVS